MGRNSKYYGIRFDRRSQNFGFHMIARSQLIADDRRSMFPYDRRRSQNFLRSAIRDPRSSAIIWKPALNVTQFKGSRLSHPCRQYEWKLMKIQFMRVAENNVTQSDSTFLSTSMVLCLFLREYPFLSNWLQLAMYFRQLHFRGIHVINKI